ncbi:ABC transporter permease [Streptomyces catenulae]|uniref:ABC transporter permease n=1 Tax=Streptomyces catenulae TaxID=66875 RepID=A0ABV2Z6L4_9ACTN|nr:ABC transporter permease [Streptomyces catenulae]
MLRTALRNLLAHPARQLMTVLAVCLGVAFVSGALVFADSTAAAHRAAATKSYADIAVTVTAKQPPGRPADRRSVLDDALVRKLAAVPGVASVRPSVDGSAALNAADGTPLRVKPGANPATAYIPGKDGKDARYPLAEGRAPADAGELALDTGTAAVGHLHLGDPITLATDGPVLTKRLVGLVTTDDTRVTTGGTLTLFDRATAQKLFAEPGTYTGIDLTATPGTDETTLADRVTQVLPADRAEATTGTAQAEQQAVLVSTLTRGYAKLPLVFAGVSLFIGSFLIVNTFTMLVARRGRESALLRAIGATRRQVSRSILLEALAVGLVASAAGFLLGLGLAAALPTLLTTGGSSLPAGPLVIGARSVLAALAVGVGVTVLAAWLPARRAAKVAPVEAMRTAARPPATGRPRLRALTGTVLLAAGVGLLLSLAGAEDASEENLRTAMAGCALLVAALIVLAPLLAVPVLRLTGRLTGRFGITGRLAQENALRDPRRTAATAATLMISTALVAGLAVIGHSTTETLDRQAASGLGADYVIGSRTFSHGLDDATVERVTATPGVDHTTAVSDTTFFLDGGVRTIAGVDPGTVDRTLKLGLVSGSLEHLGPGRIALSRSTAHENGLTTGDRVRARIGRQQDPAPYTVVAVFEDNPLAQDVLGARGEVAQHSFLPGSVQRILVGTDGHTVSRATEDRLRIAVGHSPLVTVQDREAFIEEAAGVLADLLKVVYGMLALGTVIGALGIINTLAMSVAERTREIGALRAIGMDRTAVRRMIRLEAVTVAGFGTLLGLAGGLFGAWRIGALANGAMDRYTFSLPWGTLLLLSLLSLTTGALAATLPARRAASLNPLEAVTEN